MPMRTPISTSYFSFNSTLSGTSFSCCSTAAQQHFQHAVRISIAPDRHAKVRHDGVAVFVDVATVVDDDVAHRREILV